MNFNTISTLLYCAAIVVGLLPSSVIAHVGHHDAGGHSKIVVNNAQIRAFLPMSHSTVGYLNIANQGDADVKLTKAEIDSIERVEIHQHIHANGMMKMEKVDSVLLKAHQQLDFKPGGYHLMAFEPSEPIKVGQELKLTLYFSDGNRVFTLAEVVSLESQAESTMQPEQQNMHH